MLNMSIHIRFSNFISYTLVFFCARDASRQCHVSVLMLHYQVASDSPGGATSNSKMSKSAYYRLVRYALAYMCAKNRSFLDYIGLTTSVVC